MDKLFKKELSEYVSDSNELIKEIQTVISSKKDYTLKDLDFIETRLERAAYQASFLSLTEISDFLHPVSEYIRQLKFSGNITKNSFDFVNKILRKFSEFLGQIEIHEKEGLYIDSSEVILSSYFKNIPGQQRYNECLREKTDQLQQDQQVQEALFQEKTVTSHGQ